MLSGNLQKDSALLSAKTPSPCIGTWTGLLQELRVPITLSEGLCLSRGAQDYSVRVG